MKHFKSTFALLVFTGLACACGSGGKKTVETSEAKVVATDADAKVIDVNTEKSIITWVGSKPTGRHDGTINIGSGEISLKNNEIVAGNFIIDILSLKNLDMAGQEGAKDLEAHLLDADFFDVANFPEAKFEVTGIVPFDTSKLEADKEEYPTNFAPKKLSEILVENPTHFISGNLTMRGTTKNITFPAAVSIENNRVKAKASFNIDRTDWGLTYGDEASVLDKAKDKFLYNTVKIGFELQAENK